MSTQQKYLKDENGEIFSPIVSEDSIYDNNGKALSEKLNDTGWRSFSWTDSTYMGTSQSSYTKNQWRVKNDILYIAVGVGATSTINTSTEAEIARIPITGNSSIDDSKERVWIMGVGGSGAYGGFMIKQNSSYLSVYIKPHTTGNGQTAPWFSAHFSVPLDDGYVIND